MIISKRESRKKITTYEKLLPGSCFRIPGDEDIYLKTTANFFVLLFNGRAIDDAYATGKKVEIIDDVELSYS